MIPITIDKFIKQHCEHNPNTNKNTLKQQLVQAVKSKKAGTTCSTCGAPIWAIGSTIAYYSCFTCLTGDTDCSSDYEIAEVCWL